MYRYSHWSKLSLYFGAILTCLRGPGPPERVLYSLVTIQDTLDTWINDLRGTDSPFLHFVGTKKTNFFWPKIFEKCRSLGFENFYNFQWKSGLPGEVSDVYFMIQEENVDFVTAGTGLFCHFQIWSKMTKIGKKPRKWPFSADLSVLPKNFDEKLRSHRFWSHSDQKKSIFGTFQIFQDFTVVKGPYSKSGPLCPYLTKRICSNGLYIS